MSKNLPPLPVPVRRALLKLGHDVREARIRRRIPMAVMAERALITRVTLSKIEKGDPSTSMGAYATVLFILGQNDRLAEVADVKFDDVGLALEEERLPKRIRLKSKLLNRKSEVGG
jgi:transcriptional regulator with XRE-family HTH domain